jgi:maleate isomerase
MNDASHEVAGRASVPMEKEAKRRVLLGMLTPSSNTILEPVTSAMLQRLPEVTAHFGRFRVTEISLGDKALGQFDIQPIMDASRLLADARVQVIAWNGTSGGWLGLERDRKLCEAIKAETGIPGTSSVLALAEIFRLTGVRRFGLVTPYLDEVQEKIVANFEREGFECVSERHLRDPGNFSFSEFSAETIAGMVREVAAARPQAITIFCTNMNGAPLVDSLERETGIPVYDSVATAVWSSLKIAGVDPARVKGWGRLFQEVR